MLTLQNNSSGAVYVTLQENVVNVATASFTWRLINKESLQNYVFWADDFSTSPYYDSFTISIGPGSATAGYVNCGYGQFTYEVYEMPNPYDLNLNNAIGMVETGILIVNPTYSVNASFTQSIPTIPLNKNLDRI